MHFIVDENDRIRGFHIEMWDSNSLGEKLVKKIEKYKGKRIEEFLKFAMIERLFLHTATMYMMGSKKYGAVYFWAAPVLFGKNTILEMTNMFKTMSGGKLKISELLNCGRMDITLEGHTETKNVFCEDLLMDECLANKSKVVIFNLKFNEKEFGGLVDFNIARNSRAVLRVLKSVNGKEKLIQISGALPAFIGVKKFPNFYLDVLYCEDIDKLTKEKCKEYEKIVATFPTDEKNAGIIQEKMKFILKLNS